MNEEDRAMPPKRYRWWMVAVLLAGSLGLYGATMSRGVFPGLPAKSLAWHLRLDPAPTLLDSLWGGIVRLCARLGDSTALWTGLLSVVSGALCVALVGLLVSRIRYPLHDKHDPEEVAREDQARLLAGLTAGIFLALSIPFWILSTRSLPGAFHVLLLLLSAFVFSEYQRTGRTGFLYALGLVYGVGIAEFPTFWVFLPMAALLVVRAMLQRASFRWSVLIRAALCMVPGLLLYLWSGWTLWQVPAVQLRGFQSMWSVIWYIWRDQWHLIVHAPQTSGFLLVLAMAAGPWGVLFLMRPKKPPWRYSAWQVFLRLVVLAVSVGVLYNAPLSPWHFFGMHYLMATPYLILAACGGYVAGEFWVMGQVREHRNAGVGQPLRSSLGVLALLLPLIGAGAGYFNLPVADGRPGTVVDHLAGEALDTLQGRDVVISNGALDDVLGVLAHDRGASVRLIALPQGNVALYRQYLSGIFTQPRQQALLQVSLSAFLQDFLAEPEGLAKSASLDMADPLREFGYLVPDRFLYTAVPDETLVDLKALAESQAPFWRRMEALADQPPDPRHPAANYLQYMLRMASKVANNLGFAMVERGEAEPAEALFHQARRIHPENVSALLNLMTIAQANESPELEAYQAEWEEFKERHMDARVMWSLGALYGYVYNTGFLVRHGMMWAVSGKPRMAEAELRRAAGRDHAVSPSVKAFLARAYLHGGDRETSAAYYREALGENPGDVQSLLMLAQLALADGDVDEAEQCLADIEKAGVSRERLRFERAVAAYLRGQPDAALEQLKQLVRQEPGNVRAWALLALLTGEGGDGDSYEQALTALRDLRGTSPDIRLMLAELHMSRQEWGQARAEIEQVTRMNPRLVRAWEMLVRVDFSERKQELAEDHVRILLTLDPENYTGNLMLGAFQYGRAQYSLAESSYRAALAARRDPVVLNDLAYLIMLKGGDLEEARSFIEEAVASEPAHPLFLSTRGELNLIEGRLDEAERDLQQALANRPDYAPNLLLTARLYVARQQVPPARELAESLLDRQGELPPEQQKQLQDLLQQLK